MERHLKLINARVPLRPTLTLLIVHDLHLRSERVAVIGWEKLGTVPRCDQFYLLITQEVFLCAKVAPGTRTFCVPPRHRACLLIFFT